MNYKYVKRVRKRRRYPRHVTSDSSETETESEDEVREIGYGTVGCLLKDPTTEVQCRDARVLMDRMICKDRAVFWEMRRRILARKLEEVNMGVFSRTYDVKTLKFEEGFLRKDERMVQVTFPNGLILMDARADDPCAFVNRMNRYNLDNLLYRVTSGFLDYDAFMRGKSNYLREKGETVCLDLDPDPEFRFGEELRELPTPDPWI